MSNVPPDVLKLNHELVEKLNDYRHLGEETLLETLLCVAVAVASSNLRRSTAETVTVLDARLREIAAATTADGKSH